MFLNIPISLNILTFILIQRLTSINKNERLKAVRGTFLYFEHCTLFFLFFAGFGRKYNKGGENKIFKCHAQKITFTLTIHKLYVGCFFYCGIGL